ncbi:Acid phosphatase 1 [Glycine soja]|uniref:Acid phosphatase 1 n=1 Tax=Glycine soja TaxID=3848 RepID=A0A445GYD4_GLYSO|nr:Acid phosphatase 1 [Glycine soja]RZB66277.1 Acid phosphatase 1 [Glycine soja]
MNPTDFRFLLAPSSIEAPSPVLPLKLLPLLPLKLLQLFDFIAPTSPLEASLEVFDREKFNNWVEKGVTPAIEPSLKLYEDVLNLGFKVILLTGRSERRRSVTVDNLINAGFKEWDQLILRISEFHNLFCLFCAGIDL